MGDLQDIAAAFERHPDIELVRRTGAGWMVKLSAGWLAEHYGTGASIEDAYADACDRMQAITLAGQTLPRAA